MQKIAFWRSIGAAYAFVFTQPVRLLRTGGIWLAIFALYALWLALPGTTARPTSLADALRHGAIGIAVLLFYLFGLTSFAVAWHRAVLLDEDRPWLSALRFRRREWRFLGNGLLVALALGVPFFFVGWIVALLNVAFVGKAHAGFGTLVLILFGENCALGGLIWLF